MKSTVLPECLTDLTAKVESGVLEPVIGRSNELASICNVLRQAGKANVMLLGPAGVGKTALAEALAKAAAEGALPEGVRISRIYELNTTALLADTMWRGQYEKKLQDVLDFLRADDASVLFIDEAHTLMGLGSAGIGRGAAGDLSQILKPALARGDIRAIAATTSDEYRIFIAPDGAFARRFVTVAIPDLDDASVLALLARLNKKSALTTGVELTQSSLSRIVSLTNARCPSRHQPDKSIDAFKLIINRLNTEIGRKTKQSSKDTSLAGLAAILEKQLSALKAGDTDAVVAAARTHLGLHGDTAQSVDVDDRGMAECLGGMLHVA